MLAAVGQHLGETCPFLRTVVLAAKFPLAVAPAAVGDHRREALIDAAGVDCYRAAKARSGDADAGAIDRGMLRQEGERVAGILDLVKADHPAALALAVAAPAHVEAQR